MFNNQLLWIKSSVQYEYWGAYSEMDHLYLVTHVIMQRAFVNLAGAVTHMGSRS